MKRIFSFSAALLSLSLASLCGAEAPAAKAPSAEATAKPTTFTAKVKGKRVRMRTQADLNAPIVRELEKNEHLIVLGEENGFYAVRPPKGTKAFVFRTYVLDDAIEGDNVNIRLEPHLEAPVIAQLQRGTRIHGLVSPVNSKWLEIAVPETSRFYVAKDYLTYVGDENALARMEQRNQEANHLLNDAYLLSQSELRKPFNEINLERIENGFLKIIQEYKDLAQYATKAQEALTLVRENYTQKKLAFLESKVADTNKQWAEKNSKLESAIASSQKQLEDLERHLRPEAQQTAVATETIAVAAAPRPTEPALSQSWQLAEEKLLNNWQKSHPETNQEDFYLSEKLRASTLMGVVEPYDLSVPNRPGDFVLRHEGVPVAYLYSTRINLNNYIGSTISVQGVPRANNNFALPAYFVLEAVAEK